MFLHLGDDYIVNERDIIGIFDLDTTTVSAHTRAFLAQAERDRRVITINTDLPKSFVVCSGFAGEWVYLSSLNAATLKKRISSTEFVGINCV